MKVAIWDIDNCLADDSPRHHLIDWSKEGDERYDAYNRAMLQDEPAHAEGFKLLCRVGYSPVFFTGANERYRGLRAMWIRRNLGVEHPVIYMRPEGCGLSPVDLKASMLHQLQHFSWQCHELEIMAAFDDLPEVVAMYRERGIPAAQLAVNDPTLAYAPPKVAAC